MPPETVAHPLPTTGPDLAGVGWKRVDGSGAIGREYGGLRVEARDSVGGAHRPVRVQIPFPAPSFLRQSPRRWRAFSLVSCSVDTSAPSRHRTPAMRFEALASASLARTTGSSSWGAWPPRVLRAGGGAAGVHDPAVSAHSREGLSTWAVSTTEQLLWTELIEGDRSVWLRGQVVLTGAGGQRSGSSSSI